MFMKSPLMKPKFMRPLKVKKNPRLLTANLRSIPLFLMTLYISKLILLISQVMKADSLELVPP
jgi:hypothetical protein